MAVGPEIAKGNNMVMSANTQPNIVHLMTLMTAKRPIRAEAKNHPMINPIGGIKL